jgi:hypothetical protein
VETVPSKTLCAPRVKPTPKWDTLSIPTGDPSMTSNDVEVYEGAQIVPEWPHSSAEEFALLKTASEDANLESEVRAWPHF